MAAETSSDEMTAQVSPWWAQELAEKYQSGIAHAFLLHGNIQDYISVAGLTLKSYLAASFEKRTLVVSWDRATGFVLPTVAQRRFFAELAGISVAPAAQPGRPGSGLSAGLNQYAQSSGPTPGSDLTAILGRIRQPEVALEMLSRVLHAHPTQEQLKAHQEERRHEDKKKMKRSGGEVPEDKLSFHLAVVIDYAETIIPTAEAAAAEADRQALVTLASWGRDALLGELGHIIILMTNELHDLNERLRRSSARWEQIRLPFPSLAERDDFLRQELADPHLEVKLAPDTTIEQVARLTTGMRYIDLEDILLRASHLKEPLAPALVKRRKDEIMRSEFEEVLNIVDHEFGFEALGGLEEIKRDLYETIVVPMRAGELRLVPQGVLLMGPAGTGKTRLARALAKEAGVTFVELQLAKIYSRWVGDTERRLERALEAISAWRPCLVFIDEIDQAMARGESGDSGVSQRVFKRLMETMSDTSLRGHVLYIGATNRPDLLDPALLRPGRLDKHIPILAPDQEERAAILDVLTRSAFPAQTDAWPPAEVYQRLAEQMRDYTGAEIEAVVGKAAQVRARARGALSIADALAQAFEKILPTTQQVEEMTRLALLYCSDLDLVPSRLRDLARQLRHPQAKAPTEEAPEASTQPTRRTSRGRAW
jgi:transitional endoplasmic reticulum ATPase